LQPEECEELSIPATWGAICKACIRERVQRREDAKQLDDQDFGTEGDLRRDRILGDALGRFFGPRRATFGRAFQGYSVAHALLAVEVFAFHTSLLCVAIEKSVLPLLEQLPDHEQLVAALRSQLLSVIDCGNARPTHPEAKQLLRAALLAGLEDMAKEHGTSPAASPTTNGRRDCTSLGRTVETSGSEEGGSLLRG
jgi:hypothetical protein